MNDESRSKTQPINTIIVKVAERDRGNGRHSSSLPGMGARWWSRVLYWWHLHGQQPDWRSPRWLAVGCAVLMALLAAAVSSAYFTEPVQHRQAVRAPVASTGNNTAESGNEPTAPVAPTAVAAPAVAPSAYAAASTIYVVQPEDTLYRIAHRYGTTIEALDQINQLNNTISVGQVLVIPPGNFGTAAAFAPNDQYACVQFSFQQAAHGAKAGVYALHDVTGGQIAAWSAPTGAQDSGWIYHLPVAFASVHARVLFYPRYGGGAAVEMIILNHAPDTTAGWLTRGMCHSLELDFPQD